MKKMVIFSSQTCPFGDAGAIRLHYLAKIFKCNGFDVTIIGINFSKEEIFKDKEIDTINYHFFKANNRYYFSQMRKYLLSNGKIDVVLVYMIPIGALLYLKKYAKKNKIQLLHDSVEWYSPSEFNRPFLSYEYMRREIYNRFLIDRQFKVISISRYLYSYFKSKGISTVRIPVIMEIPENSFKEKNINRDYIKIAYIGGYAPKKDQIDLFLKAYLELNEEIKNKIKFYFIGMDSSKVALLANKSEDEINRNVICYGRVNREKLLELMNEIDFTVIIRNSRERYAKAGFPTKIVESLSSGVPVIANLSSDLELYLKDKENSILLKEMNTQAIKEGLLKIFSLSNEERKKMHLQSYQTARKFFNYLLYKDKVSELLEKK